MHTRGRYAQMTDAACMWSSTAASPTDLGCDMYGRHQRGGFIGKQNGQLPCSAPTCGTVTQRVLRDLVRVLAFEAMPALWATAVSGWTRRWSCMYTISCSAASGCEHGRTRRPNLLLSRSVLCPSHVVPTSQHVRLTVRQEWLQVL